MDESENYLPRYIVVSVEPIEDENGNLIDFECEVKPDNIIAEVIDSSDEYETDFIETKKIVLVPQEIVDFCKQIRDSYGDKCLLEEEDIDDA